MIIILWQYVCEILIFLLLFTISLQNMDDHGSPQVPIPHNTKQCLDPYYPCSCSDVHLQKGVRYVTHCFPMPCLPSQCSMNATFSKLFFLIMCRKNFYCLFLIHLSIEPHLYCLKFHFNLWRIVQHSLPYRNIYIT